MDHALCGCKRAKLICSNIFRKVDKHIRRANNFADRLICLANHLSDEDFEKACIAFWAIWNDRKSVLQVVKIMGWEQRCEWIIGYWKETRLVTTCDWKDVLPSIGDPTIQNDSYKLFIDAAVNSNFNGVGYGLVGMGPRVI